MELKSYGKDNDIIFIESDEILINDVNSALDLMMSVQYETNSNKIIIKKESIVEDFFDLKTKIAGEVLQKFINYNVKVAIIGDFSIYTSKALKDFIYECNSGRDIFYLENLESAINKFENL